MLHVYASSEQQTHESIPRLSPLPLQSWSCGCWRPAGARGTACSTSWSSPAGGSCRSACASWGGCRLSSARSWRSSSTPASETSWRQQGMRWRGSRRQCRGIAAAAVVRGRQGRRQMVQTVNLQLRQKEAEGSLHHVVRLRGKQRRQQQPVRRSCSGGWGLLRRGVRQCAGELRWSLAERSCNRLPLSPGSLAFCTRLFLAEIWESVRPAKCHQDQPRASGGKRRRFIGLNESSAARKRRGRFPLPQIGRAGQHRKSRLISPQGFKGSFGSGRESGAWRKPSQACCRPQLQRQQLPLLGAHPTYTWQCHQ